MTSACSEIVWLHRVFSELGFLQSSPTPLHVNNTSAIQITENPIFREQTKHIQVNCHSIQEAYNDHVISLPHVSTDLHNAGIFTKALSKTHHQFLVDKLLLVNSPASI